MGAHGKVVLILRRLLQAVPALIGIIIVTAIGIPLGLANYSGIVSAPPSLKPTLLQLDFSRLGEASFLIVIFSFLFVDVFDNAGTLIGVTHRAGLTDADLDRVVDERWDPPVTLGVRLVSIVNDDVTHTGQASFIRGILERR